MAEVDPHTRSQSHRNENSAPDQHDDKTPKRIAQEQPMATPAVSQRTDNAQYPPGEQIAHAGKRDETAAGWPALYETLKFSAKYGPLRSVRSLSVVNQKHGFDCPSCAWPDPDGDRSFAEFCENGAKAVGHEMDTRRVGSEFFAKHSVADLSTRSDYWLEQQGRLTHPMILRAGATHYEPIAWD